MAFTKITNTELNSRGATTLPNQPTISAAALKQEFDAPAKEIVAPHFNNLIDELEADTAGASIGLQAPSRRTGSTVKAVVDAISQDLVTVEGKLNGVTNAGLLDAISLKHEHENKALLDTYDQTNEDIEDAVNKKHSHSNKSVIDKWSESAGGAPLYNGQPMTGDMYSGEYDPDSTVKNAGGIESYVTTGLGTKVDKVEGKGLSTNDFTDALKTKLDNVETGAEVNVQSDWNESDNSADDYIKNKPSLGTASAKNSTSVVTDSSDVVESGAVYTALQDKVSWDDAEGYVGKNKFKISFDEIVSVNTVGTWSGRTFTRQGVSFTVNDDLSITVNGTNSGLSFQFLIHNRNNANNLLKAGKYIYTAEGAASNWFVRFFTTRSGSAYTYGDIPTDGNEIVADVLATDIQGAFININANATVNNVTVKVMIREASVSDSTYQPYLISNTDLAVNKADNSVIGTVEDGTNPTKSYAVGEHMIRGGKFCTVTSPVTTSSTWTLGGNYVEGTIADNLAIKNGTVTPETGIIVSNYTSLKKVSNVCVFDFRIEGSSLTADTATKVATIQSGFRPDIVVSAIGLDITNSANIVRVYILTTGEVYFTSHSGLSNYKIQGSISWII